jgi:SAM-dependent methyltransferase
MADLGELPPSNSFLERAEDPVDEKVYPLRVMLCDQCWLVQTEDFVGREECFSAVYPYFSSTSSTWKNHVETFVRRMICELNLGTEHQVVELACNDGCLLSHFHRAGIPSYGVEPTKSTADVARASGLDVVQEFFGENLARQLVSQRGHVDLIVANNVLAHVPHLMDFLLGINLLLKPTGLASFEFPHLLPMIRDNHFDTIYHEHFSYFSLLALVPACERAGLTIRKVEEIPTHGESLRIFVGKIRADQRPDLSVSRMLELEKDFGLASFSPYAGFQSAMDISALCFKNSLLKWKGQGRSVVGYGAAAKANTLLNFAGINSSLLPFVSDRSPGKIGRFLPGSKIPVLSEPALSTNKPDLVVILPWNIRDEITAQLEYVRGWGGRLAVPRPAWEVF